MAASGQKNLVSELFQTQAELIAALFIVLGVMHVGFALELRSIAVDVRSRIPRPSTGKSVARG